MRVVSTHTAPIIVKPLTEKPNQPPVFLPFVVESTQKRPAVYTEFALKPGFDPRFLLLSTSSQSSPTASGTFTSTVSPERLRRLASSKAAACPVKLASLSEKTTTFFTPAGTASKAARFEAPSAAQTGKPKSAEAASAVSTPSATPSTAPGLPSSTAAPRIFPGVTRLGDSIGAFMPSSVR